MFYDIHVKSFALMRQACLLLVFLFATVKQTCADGSYKFNLIDASGNTERYVNDIISDKYGFTWIASSGSLNRFDGYNLKSYDMNGRKVDVKTLGVDDYDVLWGWTGYCLCRLDRANDVLTDDARKPLARIGVKEKVLGILMDSDRRLWMWGKKTLYLCATRQNQARTFNIGQRIVSLAGRGDKIFLLTTDGSLLRANLHNESVKKETEIDSLCDYAKLYLDTQGRLWVYDTFGSYAHCFSTDDQLQQRLIPSALKGKCIKDIEDDGTGMLWIATNNNGIGLLNADRNGISFLVHDSDNAFSVPSNHVNALYLDERGIMWTGTTKSYVAYTIPKSQPLKIIRTPIDEDVACLMQTFRGDLWMGFDGKGLIVYPYSKYGDSRRLAYSSQNGGNAPIVGLYQQTSGNHRVWIGSYGEGIMTADENGRIEPFDTDVSVKHVRFLRVDNKGRLWAGTFKDGLFVFDIINGNHGRLIKRFSRSNSPLKSNTISGLSMPTKEKYAIVSAINGLYKVDLNTLNMSLVSNINAECMLRDSRFLTWIGNGQGISVFDGDMRLLCNMTTEDGLSNNHVISIVADKDGNIWAATDNGFTYITFNGLQDQADKRFVCHPYNVEIFHDKRLAFNRHSAICLSNGHVLFGAMGCIADIDPSAITWPTLTGKVLFAGLYVNGKSIEINDTVNGVIPLRQCLYMGKKISLPSSCDIAFSVTTPDALRHNGVRYMYQIDESEWRKCDLNVITLGRLPVGNHTLRVCATFGIKDRSAISELSFSVGNWWQRPWIVSAAVVMAILSIVFIINLYTKHKKKIYEQRLQQMVLKAERECIMRVECDNGDILNADESLVSKAMSIVKANMSDVDFSINDFSGQMGMSRSNLYKKLKTATGLSPLEFMRNVRMQYGLQLLEKSGLNVSEIAYQVGLSPKQFTHFFKLEHGTLPSLYRKRKKES